MLLRELKKIYRLPQVLIIALLMFIIFHLSGSAVRIRSGYYSWFDHEAAFTRELQEAGFSEFDDDAEIWMRKKLQEIYGQYEAYFAEDPLFYENGIVTWQDFEEWDIPEEILDEALDNLNHQFNPVYTELTVSWRRQIIERMLECADVFKNSAVSVFEKNYYMTNSERRDLKRVVRDNSWRSLLPEGTVYNTNLFWRLILCGMIVSVFILICPYLTSENVQKMRSLQYVTKTGRKLLRHQLLAVITASLILYLIWTVVFLGVFTLDHHYESFFNMRIISLTFDMFRFNMTYFMYLVIILLLCSAAVLIAAAISFVISCTSMNYISMFLKMIVGCGAVCLLHSTLLFEGDVFSWTNWYNRLFHLRGIEIIITIGSLLIWALILRRLILKCEKTDII